MQQLWHRSEPGKPFAPWRAAPTSRRRRLLWPVLVTALLASGATSEGAKQAPPQPAPPAPPAEPARPATRREPVRTGTRRAVAALQTTPPRAASATASVPALTEVVHQEVLARTASLSPAQARAVARAVVVEAKALGLDPLLFVAVMQIESSFNHLAVSPAGAMGLMQLMPTTARQVAGELGLTWQRDSGFDPVLNVRLGVHYLAQMLRRFRRVEHALTAYNRGPAATFALLKESGALPVEVDAYYAAKVLAAHRVLKKRYQHVRLAAG